MQKQEGAPHLEIPWTLQDSALLQAQSWVPLLGSVWSAGFAMLCRRVWAPHPQPATSKGQDSAQQRRSNHLLPGNYVSAFTTCGLNHCQAPQVTAHVSGEGSGTSLGRLFQPSWRQIRLHDTEHPARGQLLTIRPPGKGHLCCHLWFYARGETSPSGNCGSKTLILPLQVDPSL